jgi:hypothetical protein
LLPPVATGMTRFLSDAAGSSYRYRRVEREGVKRMFELQIRHINNLNLLVLEAGAGASDRARGYYDPDHNEVVITLNARCIGS